MRNLFIAAAFCFASSFAHAGGGPCGIELGTYAVTKKACQAFRAGKPEIGDEAGYRTFYKDGTLQLYEGHCSIKDPKMDKDLCKFRALCYNEGDAEVVRFSLRKLENFDLVENSQPKYPIRLYYCSPKGF